MSFWKKLFGGLATPTPKTQPATAATQVTFRSSRHESAVAQLSTLTKKRIHVKTILKILKISTAAALIFVGCATGPTPAEIAHQQAEAEAQKTREAEAREAEAYKKASVSRAALKQYLEANHQSKYAKRAIAALEVELRAVTVQTGSAKVSSTPDGTTVVNTSSHSETFTVGDSTRKVVESFLGRGTPQTSGNQDGLIGYGWRVQYKRGTETFGFSDMFSGGPPRGNIILFFDGNDILRKISEVD